MWSVLKSLKLAQNENSLFCKGMLSRYEHSSIHVAFFELIMFNQNVNLGGENNRLLSLSLLQMTASLHSFLSATPTTQNQSTTVA